MQKNHPCTYKFDHLPVELVIIDITEGGVTFPILKSHPQIFYFPMLQVVWVIQRHASLDHNPKLR